MNENALLQQRILELEMYVEKLKRAFDLQEDKLFINPQVKFQRPVFDRENTKQFN